MMKDSMTVPSPLTTSVAARIRTEAPMSKGGLVRHDDRASEGYTLFAALRSTTTHLVDMKRCPREPERLHLAFATLESSVRAAGDGPGCNLHVANALWGQQGFDFLDEFLALTKKHYGAGLREVDFTRATEQPWQTINAWVEDQTQHMIKEPLQEGDLKPGDVLVLTNAVYFKGDWAFQFDRQRTQDAPFWINKSQSVVVPMMHQLGRSSCCTIALGVMRRS